MNRLPIDDNKLQEIIREVVAQLLAGLPQQSDDRIQIQAASTECKPKDTAGVRVASQTPSTSSSCYSCNSTEVSCGGCGECVTKRPEDIGKMVDLGAERIGFKGCPDTAVCQNLAPFIDHTLLKPDASDDDIVKLCKEAIQYRFAAVCVNSAFVSLAAGILKGSTVKVATVVGFPLGAMSTEAKAFETRDAVAHGADEIDMVINIGKLKTRDYQYVFQDIRAIVQAAQGREVKVIIEAAILNEDEKIAACILSKAAGAHFVKTSTGFGPGGATAQDVALMRAVVGPHMGIKAAGGIRDCQKAVEMLKAGATRIGASASVAIVNPS